MQNRPRNLSKMDMESHRKSFQHRPQNDRKLNEIYGSNEALVEDFDQNFYFLKKKFNLNIFEEILKSNKSIIIDKNYNKYIFEDLVINLKKNEKRNYKSYL